MSEPSGGEEQLRLLEPVDASEALAYWLPVVRGWSGESLVEEVGSTGIPGLPTKGDLDLVVVAASPRHFEGCREQLSLYLEPHEPEHWSDAWASFTGDHLDAGPVGVQVVVKNSEEDRVLRGFRALLLSNSAVVEDYTTLKRAYADKPMREYRLAKGEFVESLIVF
jgi:GrpB-like predicted nucleotidyltransferase (UPF0157 family)